jgi:membrane associated rhomboid family serine protease
MSLRRGRVRPWAALPFVHLGVQMMQAEYQPPFTLASMLSITAVYLRPSLLTVLSTGRRITDFCMIPAGVVEAWDLRRLLLSALVHTDSYHLYYNCATMLWQGTHLEARLGTLAYAKLLATLLATSHTLFVALAYALSFLGAGPYYSVSAGCSNGALCGHSIRPPPRASGLQNRPVQRTSGGSRCARFCSVVCAQDGHVL